MAIIMSCNANIASAEDKYLRFGAGIDFPLDSEFTDEDCRDDNFSWLYGCGGGKGGAAYRRSAGGFSDGLTLEVGVGLKTESNFRIETVLNYLPSRDFFGQANYNVSADLQEASASVSTVSGMLAGYLDFPLSEDNVEESFTPFLGAGFGIAQTTVEDFRIRFPATTTHVPTGVFTRSAWMVTIGMARKVSDRMTIEASLRHTDFGTIFTGTGKGEVTFNNNRSRDPIELDNLGKTQARLRSYGFGVAIRHSF